MQEDRQNGGSSEDPVEGRNDVPPPEQGSPGGKTSDADDEAAENVEKGEGKDPNPLAPPINTKAGS
ncbi:hypothetical protein [Sphingobium chlorophenolicum]|uniref:Uncharacterized protein n=1 Tax=Sphingobium chlorophenolicum TaxID=46429 RepID=A0A081RB59_SPHCR|nr:hypothetical protein [Sphingobium chlorophenolicum]KEQ52432.1 hypothetical protein BV95_03326 [Sphingobium chlorophenolicum]